MVLCDMLPLFLCAALTMCKEPLELVELECGQEMMPNDQELEKVLTFAKKKGGRLRLDLYCATSLDYDLARYARKAFQLSKLLIKRGFRVSCTLFLPGKKNVIVIYRASDFPTLLSRD